MKKSAMASIINKAIRHNCLEERSWRQIWKERNHPANRSLYRAFKELIDDIT